MHAEGLEAHTGWSRLCAPSLSNVCVKDARTAGQLSLRVADMKTEAEALMSGSPGEVAAAPERISKAY